jgi:uncharacterized protein YnzC (UPF0291/DUF896 family)
VNDLLLFVYSFRLDIQETAWQSSKVNEQAWYSYSVKTHGLEDSWMSMDDIIARINELARKAKAEGLTDEEIDERNELRKQYIAIFKGNLKVQLDSIRYVEDEE